jgi:uncharacterized protein
LFKVTESGGAVTFAVRVKPRASRDAIEGEHGEALSVRLTAPPVEGAANEALRKLLAKALGVSASSVEIVAGHSGRQKVVRVSGVSAAAISGLLRPG